MTQPILDSPRLTLRPFAAADAAMVQALAGDRTIADTTLNIPHPYEDGMAEDWIAGHEEQFRNRSNVIFAITDREDGRLLGAVSLRIETPFRKAELGYWVGVPYWNRGYATEAAGALLAYGFDELDLNRIAAQHLARNPASGRVMQKLGMRHEGTLRQATMKWGEFEDLELYSMLRSEWAAS